MKINFKLNEKNISVDAPPMKRLLDVLREDLGLTGSKEGCGEGECGACSIMLDKQLVNSCLVPIAQCEGASILTIEGLGTEENLHPIQQAFLECGGAQCGICTPGMVMASFDLLKKNSNPTVSQIQTGLAGNLCRCTGYVKIIDSVTKAAETFK
ncbi:MAG: (2Fe-2S)-binding protein [Bdellovibrionaceae bacterium]|nr:(2Fe-2S)-binding protein [Pseudobdellovibrionaceae bacterium]